MAQTTTLSSLGFSNPIILDPKLKTTSVQFTVSGGATAGASTTFVQFTLDDPTLFGGPAVTWSNLSSSITSSAADNGVGVLYTILSPLGGLRIGSTASTVTGTLTVKSLQSVTG